MRMHAYACIYRIYAHRIYAHTCVYFITTPTWLANSLAPSYHIYEYLKATNLAREQLGHGGLGHERLPCHLQPRSVVHHEPCRSNVRRGLRVLVLHALKVPDRGAELLS